MVDLVRMTYGHSGADTKTNSLGQRPMQARVYEARAAQFLLLKAYTLSLHDALPI